jgi:hypothetical protein
MESVDWPGAFRVWEYARQLRQVVCRLASLRLRSCHSFAQELCLQEIRDIHDQTLDFFENSELDPTDIESGLEYRPHGSVVELADLSLFDGSDKFELLKDYMSSLSMVGVGLLTYRSLTTGILKHSISSFSRIGKLVCTGIALAGICVLILGCGLFLLKLTDMKHGIQSKVVEKMRQYFTKCDFVKTNQTYLQLTTRRVLHSSIHDYHKTFQTVFEEKKGLVSKQTQCKSEAETQLRALSNLETKTSSLLENLEHVSFQE